jgi:hypothetical protein
MFDICKVTGINTADRKISNHTGRKTMIRGLQSTGLSLDKMRLQSRHHTDEGLKPYMSSRESEKLDMMNKFVEQFHDAESKAKCNNFTIIFNLKEVLFIYLYLANDARRLSESKSNKSEEGQENHGFMKANEGKIQFNILFHKFY